MATPTWSDLAYMLFAFILDAIVYAIAGNTPGKALLQVKVADIRGLRPGFWRHLVRNLYVWSMGRASASSWSLR